MSQKIDAKKLKETFEQAGYHRIALYVDWVDKEMARGLIATHFSFSSGFQSLTLGSKGKSPLEYLDDVAKKAIPPTSDEHQRILTFLNNILQESLEISEASPVPEDRPI